MLQTLKAMTERYNRYLTFVGRKRACDVLLNSSDRMLEDAGFSRALLQEGVSAWPWRISEDDQNTKPINFDTESTRLAIKELTSYSAAELHDLGITHGDIKEAVLKGREGIDKNPDRKAA